MSLLKYLLLFALRTYDDALAIQAVCKRFFYLILNDVDLYIYMAPQMKGHPIAEIREVLQCQRTEAQL